MSKDEIILSLHVLIGEWQKKYREEVRLPHNEGRINLLSECMDDVRDVVEEHEHP